MIKMIIDDRTGWTEHRMNRAEEMTRIEGGQWECQQETNEIQYGGNSQPFPWKALNVPYNPFDISHCNNIFAQINCKKNDWWLDI